MKKTISLAAVIFLLFTASPMFRSVSGEEPGAPEIANVSYDYNNNFGSVPIIITGENITEKTEVYSLNAEAINFDQFSEEPLEAIYKNSFNNPDLEELPFDQAFINSKISYDKGIITAQLSGDFIWLVNPDGKRSKPFQITKLKIHWISDETVEQGDSIKIFGMGFSAGSTKALLKSKNSDTYIDITREAYADARGRGGADNYLYYFRISDDIPEGEWEVLITNGRNNFSWVNAGTINVIKRTNKNNKEFLLSDKASVINVKDFGAKGDGAANDTNAFKRAFEKTGKNKDVVIMPVGTYLVDETLIIPENVSLIGADRENTVIKGIGFNPETTDNITWFSNTLHGRNTPFSVVYLNSNTSLRDVTVKGAVNKGLGGFGIVQIGIDDFKMSTGGMAENIMISDCKILSVDQDSKSGILYYPDSVYSVGSVKRLKMLDNELYGTFYLGGYTGTSRVYRSDFIGNTIRGGTANDNQAFHAFAVDCFFDKNVIRDSPGRFVICPIEHNYIKNTDFVDYVKQAGNNTPESYLMHGGSNRVFRTDGFVKSADENTLTDEDGNFVKGIYKGAYVMITYGKGMGQYRRVKDNTEDTLELEEPFYMAPDKTSEYVVGFFFVENVFNENYNSSVAIFCLHGEGLGNIIEKYRGDQAGINFLNGDPSNVNDEGHSVGSTFQPMWYNIINNSWIDGGSFTYWNFSNPTTPYNGIASFGNAIANSYVNMSNAEKSANVKSGFNPYLMTLRGGTETTKYDASHTLVYNNVISNSGAGIEVFGAMNSTIIFANSFTNVDTCMYDLGDNTLFLRNEKIDPITNEKTYIENGTGVNTAAPRQFAVKPVTPKAFYDRKLDYDNQIIKEFTSAVLHKHTDKKECTDKCQSNLSSLYDLIIKFEDKYGALPHADYYPDDPMTSNRNIIKLLGYDAFKYGICPTWSDEIKGKTNNTYIWNNELNGMRIDNIENPANTWLLFDASATHNYMTGCGFAGHEIGYNVLYADGSVKHITNEMFYLDIKFLLKDSAVSFKDPSVQPKQLEILVYDEPKELNLILLISGGCAALAAVIVVVLVFVKKKKANNKKPYNL